MDILRSCIYDRHTRHNHEQPYLTPFIEKVKIIFFASEESRKGRKKDFILHRDLRNREIKKCTGVLQYAPTGFIFLPFLLSSDGFKSFFSFPPFLFSSAMLFCTNHPLYLQSWLSEI